MAGMSDRGAVRALSGLPDEGAVLRAVRLRLQSSDRLCRAGLVRPRAVLRLGGLSCRLCRQGPGACSPSSRSSSARRRRAVLGLLGGVVAIRRQGIYFAMITLALAQMMYLVALRVKFTGGEDGIQACRAGDLFGVFDLDNEMTMYAFVLVVVARRVFSDLSHHQFAVRRGAQGDPRERAARHLARLPHRPLQARRLRAVGDLGRARRID